MPMPIWSGLLHWIIDRFGRSDRLTVMASKKTPGDPGVFFDVCASTYVGQYVHAVCVRFSGAQKRCSTPTASRNSLNCTSGALGVRVRSAL